MKIKITTGFVVAFIAFRYGLQEAHELVHTATGRIICGCWGQRDFNVWSLCPGCYEKNTYAIAATFAGPLFTYIAIWTGVYFMRERNSPRQKVFGFAMIFANNPFARIFTASMGKGDEIFGLRQILHNSSLAWLAGLSIVLLFTIYPLYKAFTIIENRNRVGYFIAFLLAGIILDVLILFAIMNPLLKHGVLNNYWILGSPVLVTLFTFIMLVVFIISAKHITKAAD
ncbi:MAG TPA: hypothetical protein VLM16_02195 [Ginsengibacter sp.]|nr:hypothetical protein [Ginsengibacter sp.]